MRAKRSKDKRLVDKFSKQRDILAVKSSHQQPSNTTTSPEYDITHSEGGEDDDLQVRTHRMWNYSFKAANAENTVFFSDGVICSSIRENCYLLLSHIDPRLEKTGSNYL